VVSVTAVLIQGSFRVAYVINVRAAKTIPAPP
jgi:hypothetical protein